NENSQENQEQAQNSSEKEQQNSQQQQQAKQDEQQQQERQQNQGEENAESPEEGEPAQAVAAGQMTPEQARRFLDAQKQEDRALIFQPENKEAKSRAP